MILPLEIIWHIISFIPSPRDIKNLCSALTLDQTQAMLYWCDKNPHRRLIEEGIADIIKPLAVALNLAWGYQHQQNVFTRRDLMTILNFAKRRSIGLEQHNAISGCVKLVRNVGVNLHRLPPQSFFCPDNGHHIPHTSGDLVANMPYYMNPMQIVENCRRSGRKLIFKSTEYTLTVYTRGFSCSEITDLITALSPMKPKSIELIGEDAKCFNMFYVLSPKASVLKLNLWNTY